MKISYNGEFICLSFESPIRTARVHTIKIPIDRCGIKRNKSGNPLPDQVGWHQLLSILKAQRSAKSDEDRKIGTKAAPVQYDLERIKKALTRRKAKPEMTLEDLGL